MKLLTGNCRLNIIKMVSLVLTLCLIMVCFPMKGYAQGSTEEEPVNEETGEPVSPVQADLVYELSEPFQGDGNSAYLDTGVKLYDGSMNDYILVACISNKLGDGDNVFFSCFSEADPFRGLLLRNPTKDAYEFICGDTGQQMSHTDDATYFTIAVQRNGNDYTLFYNGESQYTVESGDIEPYDGTLLLGCELDEKGNRFRYSNVSIESLRIYKGVQSPSLTAKAMEEMLNAKMKADSGIKEAILIKDRNSVEEQSFLETLYSKFQQNGQVVIILAVGFLIACIIVSIMNHKKER